MATLFHLIDVHGNEYQNVQDHSLQMALEELNQQIEVIQRQEEQLALRKKAIEDARQEVLQQIQHRKFRQYLHEREQEARLQEYYLEQLQERRAFENVVRTIIRKRFEDEERERAHRREKAARKLLRRILVSDSPNMQLVVPNNFQQMFIHHPVVDTIYSPEESSESQAEVADQQTGPYSTSEYAGAQQSQPFRIFIQNDNAPEQQSGPDVAELNTLPNRSKTSSQASVSDEELSRTELAELNDYLLAAQRRSNKRGNARKHIDLTARESPSTSFAQMSKGALNPDPEVIEPEDEPTTFRNPLEALLSTGQYSVVSSDEDVESVRDPDDGTLPIHSTQTVEEPIDTKAGEKLTDSSKQPSPPVAEHFSNETFSASPKGAETDVKSEGSNNHEQGSFNEPKSNVDSNDSASPKRPSSQASLRHNVTVEEVPDEDA
ncbi:Protein slt1 [Schizosaccharomyces pombe]|uniref:Protein slt1 n=1 Tax=Schizosaccharomyces pombe (strain 972 / ATCC 24843) TaxID=284812 RepID=SLT1_SCHPO|nr:protein slt1 [Schizosaccharomyces pombe]O13791.3 RecName: Full=Protein slt1 [Schizosaccharomyces pombe 972h-]CAB16224.1 sequence orphan Slt1 [Schizosaccharomyces pombe]|eukprot:NP_594260.1 protein slt1 [Schizosaccharomyces pombe]